MRRMVVWLQNFQGGQSSSKYPTYIVQFMISPQMRFSWPKKWEKLSFSNEKMVVWLQNFWGGISSSKYTILSHFWNGQLKPPRLTQCTWRLTATFGNFRGSVTYKSRLCCPPFSLLRMLKMKILFYFRLPQFVLYCHLSQIKTELFVFLFYCNFRYCAWSECPEFHDHLHGGYSPWRAETHSSPAN